MFSESIDLHGLYQSHNDILSILPSWVQFVQQGIADSSVTSSESSQVICPAFGEPGWGPFCFLNGNPVFKAFDGFQLFVQNSVVSLHDGLKVHKYIYRYVT